MAWNEMSADERAITLSAMRRFGGSFVRLLAQAWQAADAEHAAKLGICYPELTSFYGPGTVPYASVVHHLSSEVAA
jgi:hypothetical protein